MLFEITSRLNSVRVRQRLDRALRWASFGLLTSSLVGIVLLGLQRFGIILESMGPWFVVLFATPLCGIVGLSWPSSWNSAAKLVDEKYKFKDRSQSALDFASRPERSPFQDLQIQDAKQHLDRVDASRVVRFQIGRTAALAVCTFGLMIALALLPNATQSSFAKDVHSLPVVLEQAQVLEETTLKELDKLAKEFQDQELMELADEIRSDIEELKHPDVDEREALAKLSEMQHSIATAMKQLEVEQIDAQLKQFAEAMHVSEATEAASHAIESGKYDQAAKELEKIEASSMERKERNAMAANLAKLSQKLGQGKLGKLSEAISEMKQGLESENESECKSGLCKAAGVCREQSIRKSISECLACQLNRLSECKGNCQGGKSGPSDVASKSQSPKNSWGTGASGQPTGEEMTTLDSTRRNETITGISGDGPSERETQSTLEARQDAARSYREKYAQFKKQMEEVLDSEPLPLGHRETVRKYFESIRPQNGDETN